MICGGAVCGRAGGLLGDPGALLTTNGGGALFSGGAGGALRMIGGAGGALFMIGIGGVLRAPLTGPIGVLDACPPGGAVGGR